MHLMMECLTFASVHCEGRTSHNTQQQSKAEALGSSVPAQIIHITVYFNVEDKNVELSITKKMGFSKKKRKRKKNKLPNKSSFSHKIE